MVSFIILIEIIILKGGDIMREFYDPYFDYDFSCKEEVINENASEYYDQVKVFNGGGSGS